MASPFIFDEPLAPGEMIDREAEIAELRSRAEQRRNARLEGPRRYGKTSLLRAGLAAAALDGAVTVEINFLGCVTPADVAERIEREYAAQLESGLRRWLRATLRTLRPTVGAGGVSVSPQASSPGLLDRLALPVRVHERTGRHCVIAFDEFQEVIRVNPALPGVFRSEIERHGKAAAYVFSGSHPGLMRELFADRRHAFFAQAAPVPVGPLPDDALAEVIGARFDAAGRDPGDALDALLDAAAGHPQRAMLLAHHLFEHTGRGKVADPETWMSALGAAQREATAEIAVTWENCSAIERRALKVVAAGTVPLRGREAAERFGLSKSGSTQVAVDRLAAEGVLTGDAATRTGWRVVDPLFTLWLNA